MIGHGARLSGSTSGNIGEITNIDWSGIIVDDVEITDFASHEGFKEFEAGLKDSGEITGDLKFLEALASTVREAIGTTQTWTLTLNNSTSILQCQGYIKQMSVAAPIGDNVMMPIAIKLTGRAFFPSSSSSSSSSSSA